jgi:release factor glutamine methyltransferase
MPDLTLSLSSLLSEGAEQLRHSGIPEPRRQALRIWSELTDGSLDGILRAQDLAVDAERSTLFRRAIRRRAQGEPLPHVTGKAGFRHLTLSSDDRALIPRPETEGLVELLLERVATGVVADVGTGSGCIALSLAIEGEFHTVLATDASAEALALARLNHRLLGSPAAVHFVRADWASAIAPGSLDALISNPPYLTLEEYQGLDPSVREWEPALALKAGNDGLRSIAGLLQEGRTAVRPGGWLALEVDCTRAEEARRMASDYGWREVSVHLDLFGRERYLLARRSDTR